MEADGDGGIRRSIEKKKEENTQKNKFLSCRSEMLFGSLNVRTGRVHFRCDIFLTANFHPFLLIAVKCLFFNRFFCPLDML